MRSCRNLSTLLSDRQGRLHPRGLVFDNFIRGVEGRALLHHRSHRAVLLFGETYSFLRDHGIDFVSGNHVMNPHRRENLRWTLGLVSLDSYLITSDFLVILLPQNSDDVECGTAGQSGGYQFDGLGSGASSSIVQQQMMAAAGLGNKLPLLLKWLVQFNLGADHGRLLLFRF